MGVFESSKVVFDTGEVNIDAVLEDARHYFQAKGFDIKTERLAGGGGHASVTKGGIFRAVLGLKTGLNIKIEPRGQSWFIGTSVGVFGQQAIPTIIMLFVAWPVLLTQIWGLVRQAKLDDEAISVVEQSLQRHAICATEISANSGHAAFCTQCGASLATGGKFCPQCGQAVAVPA